MSNFLEQLKSAKLTKPKGPIKDYSDPKLAGFLSKNAIDLYQSNVLDCNIENWYHLLKDNTFRTEFCPIELKDATLFIEIYEAYFKDKTIEDLIKINDWKSLLSQEQKKGIVSLEQRLHTVINNFIKMENFVFVKTSCRSAKDSPLASKNFKTIYLKYLEELNDNLKENENEQIICMLKAAFDSLKVKNSTQVIDMFIKSERIYQDMLLATEKLERFNQNFIIREFIEIKIDMEFRGFVFNDKLTALSQYNYLIYSKKLNEQKEEIKNKILDFYNNQIKHKLNSKNFLKNYIIDFAVLSDSKLFVIEINPFLETTDGALFSWQHERHILEDSNEFCFRITERPKPGAKTMLPLSIRKLI